VAVGATLGTALQVLYHFIDVVGLPSRFLLLVALSMIAATVLARVLRPRIAVAIGTVLLATGLWWYLQQLSGAAQFGALINDTLALLTGNSLLRISNIRAWALGVTPGPVFLTWYFAVRRRYGIAIAVAGGTLGFLVLTGDADLLTTLSGVIAGTAGLGFGDFDRRQEPIVDAETILVIAALMIVVPSVVTVVPATAGASLEISGSGGADTVEASLLQSGDQLSVQGSISLSPAVRFTVTSTESRYWRIGSFDRYTGDGWIRTTDSRQYDGGQLQRPRGPNRIVDQTFRAETSAQVMPAAWKPISVSGNSATLVDGDGSLDTSATITNGTSYQVTSAVPTVSPAKLNETGQSYPRRIEDSYTQLPESTPDRVTRRTDRLTRNARTPYETAATIEQWLESNREYSLAVDRPAGSIADAFLFEMEAGYCTYYATTMVTMLRTQGIPARFVTGYTPGERVDDGRWVVRGLNSHAWVEVYFPDVGWVSFDPTPSDPRLSAETGAISEARENDVEGVDTDETGSERDVETATPTDERETFPGVETSQPIEQERGGIATSNVSLDSGGSTDDGLSLPDPPPREHVALAGVALFGLLAGVRQSRRADRLFARIRYRVRRRSEPRVDVERAHEQLLLVLEKRHRPRRPGEPMREYLDAVDAGPQVRRLATLRERARYGDGVTREEADEARRLVQSVRTAGGRSVPGPL